jgi:salicylate hydroxylase
LVGDSAHAHGGAYATGGSLAIDDAYAFFLAINHVFPPTATQKPTAKQIGEALRLYEETRKPHAERLLRIVLKANQKKAASVGKPVADEDLRRMAAERPDTVWLAEHNVVGAFTEVLRRRAVKEGMFSANI